ncbi:hypothetical protein [Nocardia nova]|uniref:hypothetical protein n=1 Tax=Nocardia nova TaxID=37330 RepID=UPI0015E2A248|nr:hypothetical protein [Nocardia nova]
MTERAAATGRRPTRLRRSRRAGVVLGELVPGAVADTDSWIFCVDQPHVRFSP